MKGAFLPSLPSLQHERAQAALCGFVWRACKSPDVRRVASSSKGIIPLVIQQLRDCESEELKVNMSGFLLVLAGQWVEKLVKTDLVAILSKLLNEGVVPELVCNVCACLLVLAQSAVAVEKMKQHGALNGAKRALRFRRDPRLQKFAMGLIAKLR